MIVVAILFSESDAQSVEVAIVFEAQTKASGSRQCDAFFRINAEDFKKTDVAAAI